MSTEQFRPCGLDPQEEYFLERLTGELYAHRIIPEFNQTLAQDWYSKEQEEFVARTSYTFTTWPYYSAEKDPPRTSRFIIVDSDQAAVTLAEQMVSSDKESDEVVGTLVAPDGRVIARRYVIIHKADAGDGMRMKAGSWQFFAADDEAATQILQEKIVDWKNILYGTDGIIARK